MFTQSTPNTTSSHVGATQEFMANTHRSRDRPLYMPTFPAQGLLPRQETKALEFVTQNPSYDGRGVTVAVLDTGVDPGASGLQTTTEGLPKVVDIVDCTGDGDVDMSRKLSNEDVRTVTVDEERTTAAALPGVTGRWLKLNEKWVNPTGVWRIGAKARNSLLPTPVKSRVEKEQRKLMEASVEKHSSDLEKQIDKVQEEHQALAGGKSASTLSDSDFAASQKKEDLEHQREAVTQLKSKIEYDEPTFDCIVWHDGSHYVAAVDTSETGDFRDIAPMESYEVSQDWRMMDSYTQVNYGVHLYDDSDTLSIVTDCGSHGTHVAGIIAGHWPEKPYLNGVAPGAQIVSLKIGDARLDSLETGGALLRAVQAIIKHNCQVANLSFGEPASVPNSGRFIEELQSALRVYGVTFVSSAGNDGPALSTVGAPAGTSDHLISVGAIITPAMMHAAYSVNAEKQANQLGRSNVEDNPFLTDNGDDEEKEKQGDVASGDTVFDPQTGRQLRAMPFGWSSRGPCVDGYAGVTISAPGGAITCVPRWTLKRVQLMNGTSMSSPNTAGCVALLVCGAIHEGWPATTSIIRRVLVSSAMPVSLGDDWTVGAGMIDVVEAWNQLRCNAEAIQEDSYKIESFSVKTNLPLKGYDFGDDLALYGKNGVGFAEPSIDVRVPYQGAGAGSDSDRGVYWREPWQSSSNKDVVAIINVNWHDECHMQHASVESRQSLNHYKVNFLKHLRIESTASWVTCPDHLVLSNDERRLKFRVNAHDLEEGKAHYAEIRGYYCHSEAGIDTNSELVDSRGLMFAIPVTVIKPVQASKFIKDSTECCYFCNGGSTFEFTPGSVDRSFIECPEGATWAELILERLPNPDTVNPLTLNDKLENGVTDGIRQLNASQNEYIHHSDYSPSHSEMHREIASEQKQKQNDEQDTSDNSDSIILAHLRQVIPNQSNKHNSKREFKLMKKWDKHILSFPVIEGRTLEVCLGQFWSSFGVSYVRGKVVFRGVTVKGATASSQMYQNIQAAGSAVNSPIFMDTSGMPSRVDIVSKLHRVTIDPVGELTHIQTSVNPKSYSIETLDLNRDGRQGRQKWISPQELQLIYEYEVPGKSDNSSVVYQASISRLHGIDLLYDSLFDTSLLTVHDVTNVRHAVPGKCKDIRDFSVVGGVGEVVGTSDVFTENLQLVSGRKYRFEVRLSHPSLSFLKQFMCCSLTLRKKLPSPVKLTFSRHKGAAGVGAASQKITDNHNSIASTGSRSSWISRKIPRNSTIDMFMSVPSNSSIPGEAAPGDILLGSVKFCRYENVEGVGSGTRQTHPTGFPVVLTVTGKPKPPTLEFPSLPKFTLSSPEHKSSGSAAAGVPSGTSHGETGRQEESNSEPKNAQDKAREQLREAGISALKTQLASNSNDSFEALYEILFSATQTEQTSADQDDAAVVRQFLKKQLPLLQMKMDFLEKQSQEQPDKLNSMWEHAATILECLPVDDTLRYFNMVNRLTEAERRERLQRNPFRFTHAEYNTIRTAILNCLRKCCVSSSFAIRACLDISADGELSASADHFMHYFDLLSDFVKVCSSESRSVFLEYLLRRERWGSALKTLLAIMDDARNGVFPSEKHLSNPVNLNHLQRHLLARIGALEVFDTALEREQAFLRSVALKKNKRA